MPARTVILVLGALVAAAVLFVVLRPEGEESEPLPATATTATEAETTTSEEVEATTEETTTAPPEPEVERVEITVRDGGVEGGVVRATVRRGERVVLVVRSDVSDHVHLHGYDLLVDVAPGRTSRIRFRATETGRFEVELEDRGLLIAELEVRP